MVQLTSRRRGQATNLYLRAIYFIIREIVFIFIGGVEREDHLGCILSSLYDCAGGVCLGGDGDDGHVCHGIDGSALDLGDLFALCD
jgi:hypothetical protein